MEFTSNKQIPITENQVREHVDYFKDLIDQLNYDLKQQLEQSVDIEMNDTLNAL